MGDDADRHRHDRLNDTHRPFIRAARTEGWPLRERLIIGLTVSGLAACSLVASGIPRDATSAAAAQRTEPATSPPRIHYPRDHPATVIAAGTRHAVFSLLDIARPMRYGDWVWDDSPIAGGAMWIRVDLRRQILSVFRGGNEIGTSVILYGADAKPTPRGRFAILARLKDHRSSLYDAPMPYTLRITSDGVSIHGSNVRPDAATHGCIGVPTDFARHVFEVVHAGDTVTID